MARACLPAVRASPSQRATLRDEEAARHEEIKGLREAPTQTLFVLTTALILTFSQEKERFDSSPVLKSFVRILSR